eukprot:evm.model.NODE_5801_length_40303_cov_26.021786.4
MKLREGEEEEALSRAPAETLRSGLAEGEEGEPEVQGEEAADDKLEGLLGSRVERVREEGEERKEEEVDGQGEEERPPKGARDDAGEGEMVVGPEGGRGERGEEEKVMCSLRVETFFHLKEVILGHEGLDMRKGGDCVACQEDGRMSQHGP